jgi:hypothetical protein
VFRRELVTSKTTALSSVRLQPGSFNSPGAFSGRRGNARERRISVSFPATANTPKVIFHGLGFAPTGFVVLGQKKAGSIYNSFPLRSTSRVVVLKSDTANLVADILVR